MQANVYWYRIKESDGESASAGAFALTGIKKGRDRAYRRRSITQNKNVSRIVRLSTASFSGLKKILATYDFPQELSESYLNAHKGKALGYKNAKKPNMPL